jgi:Protein of unknown function (DUF1580)
MDILSETVISIHEAAAAFPGRQPGKTLNFSTIWRWILKGIRTPDGQVVRLEAVRLGARWVTSREALARFSARLTPTATDSQAAPRTPTQRQRASARAAKRLEQIGF